MYILLSIFHLLILPLSGNADLHNIHLSKTEIKYKSDQAAIQISMHIFIDDLENAIQLDGTENPRLCTDREAVNAEDLILKYLNQNFNILIDGAKANYDFIGKELSGDLMAVWCYLEITDVDYFDEVLIINNILHDLFEDQKNIISFYQDKVNTDFVILDKKTTELKIENL